MRKDGEEWNLGISTAAVKFFLEAGADAMQGLDCAVLRANLEAAQLCLEYGADPIAAEENASIDIGSEMQDLLNAWK
jgi:hypothetical protein